MNLAYGTLECRYEYEYVLICTYKYDVAIWH